MDSNFFRKLSDDLYELSNNYRKAAKETFPHMPGELSFYGSYPNSLLFYPLTWKTSHKEKNYKNWRSHSMARYKKALSIYIKESWIQEINLFASKNEESVSEYIERAVNFQLIHDRKLYQKELKEKEAKQLTYENFLTMDQEEFNNLIKEIGKAAGYRKSIEIAKTPWVDKSDD